MHDGLCQSLAGISGLSAALSRRLTATTDSASSNAAAEIASLLNEAIREARDLARGLGPVNLHEVGLERAVETLARTVEHRQHSPVPSSAVAASAASR